MKKTRTSARRAARTLTTALLLTLSAAALIGPNIFTRPSSAQTPSCQPTQEGLISWWRGESDASDGVGANGGTPVGTVSYTQGQVGQAFSFDGSGYVEVADSPTLEPSRVAVEAWVRHLGGPGYAKYILSKGANGDYAASYALYTGGGDGLYFYITGSDNFIYFSPDAGQSVWDGQWHHVLGTFDGQHLRLYVDGAQVATAALSPPAPRLNTTYLPAVASTWGATAATVPAVTTTSSGTWTRSRSIA